MKKPSHDLTQAEHYDKVAEQRLVADLEKQATYAAARELKRFLNFLALKKKSSILEIGCGTGGMTIPLLRQGHKVVGTEVSGKSLKALWEFAKKERVDKNLLTLKTDFVNEKTAQKYKNKFDTALFVGVIHHLDPENLKKIFTNVVGAVKKGGLVVAFEPNPLNPFYYPWYLWREIKNTPNVSRWQTEKGMLTTTNIWSLKGLFKKTGLKEIQVQRDAFLPNRFGNKFPLIFSLNDFLIKIPIIKEMSAFIWIKGRKI